MKSYYLLFFLFAFLVLLLTENSAQHPSFSTTDSEPSQYFEPNSLSKQNFTENIAFIEQADTINKLQNLLNMFRGKPLLVDIWATTCPPCLREFEHYPKIYPYLETNNISILYISLDKERDEEHWKNTIKKYNLVGQHIRANQNLFNDIKKETLMRGMPFYCIVDEKGKLYQGLVYRPSMKDDFINQLEEILRK